LAVGARPSLLFGAVILLVPVVYTWREKARAWTLLMAAAIPIALIGTGLMRYNFLRFGKPLEFGQRYQLPLSPEGTWPQFALQYLWFNFRISFLAPARWSSRFPFVHEIALPPLPKGTDVADPFGVLTNIPFVWLALAVPLAWRDRLAEARAGLRWFVAALAMLFGISALTLGLHNSMCLRYEVEFTPTLVLLAVIGILGVERALAHQPVWRRVARCGWGLLLGFSVAFNVLMSMERFAEADNNLGFALEKAGRVTEAVAQYKQALQIKPDLAAAYYNLGTALARLGKVTEAIGCYEQALRFQPELAAAHYDWGLALAQLGQWPEAVEHYQAAVRLQPWDPDAQYNLGVALDQSGRTVEAIGHWEKALEIKPDLVEAHYNIGNALARIGRIPEAIAHYEQTLRFRPDSLEAHNNLGGALARVGRVPEAIEQWEQALKLNPDYVEAHYNLGVALEQMGKIKEAIDHYQQVLQINTPSPTAIANRQAAEKALTRLRGRGALE